MRFTATVRLLTSQPTEGEAQLPPFDAKDAHAAARVAAMRAARGIFGETGQPGFITWPDGGAAALAVIGSYSDGLTQGVTAIIHVRLVE